MDRIIETNISGKKANEILRSVIGQMSDGIWENSGYYTGYWPFVTISDSNCIKISESSWNDFWNCYNKFKYMKDKEILEFFAKKIKQIVQTELRYKNIPVRGEFKKGNDRRLHSLDYNEIIIINDAVEVYDALMGRAAE